MTETGIDMIEATNDLAKGLANMGKKTINKIEEITKKETNKEKGKHIDKYIYENKHIMMEADFMRSIVTIYLKEDLATKIKEKAKQENKSISKTIADTLNQIL